MTACEELASIRIFRDTMHKEIEEKFERWKKIKIIYCIALVSGIIEEILKRRRRTTLAIGAVISLLAFLLK